MKNRGKTTKKFMVVIKGLYGNGIPNQKSRFIF
jgi:hypothetical protein